MKTALKMFAALTFITLVSGGLLSGLDSFTAERIKENRLRELKAAIAEVLPKYDHYEEIKTPQVTIYAGMEEGSETPVGLAFRVAGNGFQGKISMMVGLKPDFSEMTGFKVLEQVETPGLGTKIVTDPSNKDNPTWFPDQFSELLIQPEIEVVKNIKPSKDNEIQAISGATITSVAIVRILNDQIRQVQSAYENR